MGEGAEQLRARRRLGRVRLFDAARTATEEDRFGWVLLLVVIAIVGQMLIDASGSFIRSSIIHALSGCVLVVAVREAGLNRRLCHLVDFVVVTFLLANIVLALYDIRTGAQLYADRSVSPEALWLVTTVLVPVVVARRVATHRLVTVQTIMGVVAAYLQIAVAYAFVFHAVDQWERGTMFGKAVLTPSYTYFSLATITTTGYGDLAPSSQVARLFAVSEAVLGQVFLVTLVALLVSRFASGHGRRDGSAP